MPSPSALARFVLLVLGMLFVAAPRHAAAQVHTNCINCGNFSITPDGGVKNVAASSTGLTAVFQASNQQSSPNNVTFSCIATGWVTCTGIDVPSYSFDGFEEITVTVTYSTGASGGGTLTLSGSGSTWSDVGSYTVNGPPTVSLQVPVLTSGSRAVVRTRTPIIRALIGAAGSAVDSSTMVLQWGNDTVTKWRGDAYTVAQWNRGLVEWQVDSVRGLNGTGADSTLVTAKACAVNGLCTTVTRWAVLPNDSTVVLGFSNTPVGTSGGGFAAPFGPGIGVSGAEVETGFASVPYFAMGAARSAGLVYSTRQSYPRVLVPVDLELRWPTSGNPDQIVVRLFDGPVKLDSAKFTGSPSCSTGSAKRCRTVLQGDFSGPTFATPTRKWLRIESQVTLGAVSKLSSDSIEVVLVDRRQTMYGSGWWPSALAKLVGAGADRLLVGPTGTATVFRGNGDSLYIPPTGSFTILKKTASGWELRARGDSAVTRFDAAGRLQAVVDANGNRDSLAYSSVGDTLKRIVDPTGHAITLAYSSSRLATITDTTGRQTKVSIDGSNQLTYDSLSSPTAKPLTTRYVYQSYPGTNTVVLTKRIGVILDTTVVVYDSTFRRRPVQSKLPLVPDPGGSLVKPTISYTAMESRGYGALVRVDSAGPYVEMKDPLNHWTRSWLNRWGQARLTWDTLGLLGRSSYADDGRLLWSEGKKGGDTTRVYVNYDSQQRLARRFIHRVENGTGNLRLDSLVYDANHRVVKQVDSRGQADSITYDGKGNVIETRDPGGFVTRMWHGSNGLVDSVLRPNTFVVTRYIYEPVWKQLAGTHLGNSTTPMDSTAYDAAGRTSTHFERMRVKVSNGVTSWQWRGTIPYYRVTNQTDSVVWSRSGTCDPCTTPPGFSGTPEWSSPGSVDGG